MSKNTNSTRSIDVTKGHRRMIITLASIILILSITACAKNEQKSGENETADAVATELSDAVSTETEIRVLLMHICMTESMLCSKIKHMRCQDPLGKS